MKIAYSHIVKFIKEAPSIERLSESLFHLGHEHEVIDGVFDMEFTPNRGDCLSVNGLLRDLAVFFTVELNQEIYKKEINKLDIDFKNLSKNICPQVSFLRLEIESIPKKYSHYLENYFKELGVNKNNFFTDISNFLSYETGQPTHCYDAKKMNGELIFHETTHAVEFETLLNKKITLSKKNAVFSLNNDVINLAGVIGGKSTACDNNTKTVLVECAYFQPESIIGKSVNYDIQSDASHKFERGVDPDCQENVLRRFIQIVSEHTNIKDISLVSYKKNDLSKHKIPVDIKKINKIIGINISKEEYLDHLIKLGFCIKDDFIIVPSYRSDIKTHNDLAEEVARVIGYDNIDLVSISIPNKENINLMNIENKLRYFLLDHGFYEVINSPFVGSISKDAIKVDNPLDSNRQYLRTNITDSLLGNLLYNEKRQKDSVKFFEISDIYFSKKDSSISRNIAIIASGRLGLNYEDFSRKINKNYFEKIFKEILPNQTFDFNIISREELDTKINSEIISLEININSISSEILSYKELSTPPERFNQYSQISEHPSSFKDISYSIKDYGKTIELQELLLNYKNDIIQHVYIFDYYKNEKKKEIKIGFRFIFQAKKTTLTSLEIDEVYDEILKSSLKIKGVTIPGLL